DLQRVPRETPDLPRWGDGRPGQLGARGRRRLAGLAADARDRLAVAAQRHVADVQLQARAALAQLELVLAGAERESLLPLEVEDRARLAAFRDDALPVVAHRLDLEDALVGLDDDGHGRGQRGTGQQRADEPGDAAARLLRGGPLFRGRRFIGGRFGLAG